MKAFGAQRWQVALLLVALVASEAGIAWALREVVTTGQETVRYFSTLNLDTLRSSRELRRSLVEAQNSEASQTDESRRQGARDHLIQQFVKELQLTTSADERSIVARTQSAALVYLDSMARAAAQTDGDSTRLAEDAMQLHQMIDDVAALRSQRTEQAFLDQVERLRVFRYLQIGLVALLIPSIVMFAWLAYRKWLQPLRAQLIENRLLLQQREKLAALGTLASGVAHEINNPLTAIKARLYSLCKQLAAPAQAELNIVSREVDRLESIVRGMLAYAKPDPPRYTEVALHDLAHELAAFFAPEFAAREIQLRVEAATPVQLAADAGQLRQMVLNLLRNSLDACEGRRGTVVLATGLADTFPSGRIGEHAVLLVIDDGCGIPPAVQARLFDPFFTTKKSGTGLGLSIVQQLVEKHGGEIALDSHPGRGSRFELHLPLHQSVWNGPPAIRP